MNSIDIQDVSYCYGLYDGRQTSVLKQINLSIPQGDFVAIMGASGSGKSTLLHLMGGMLHLQQGRVLIEQADLATLNNQQLALLRNQRLGFVFQQFYLMPNLSVADNIGLASQFPLAKAVDNQTRQQRVQDLAQQLGISHRLQHLPQALSGGEKQRTVVARALFNDVNIILADEPTGNLDSHNTAQLLQLLETINQRGKTVVIVTHDPEVAAIAKRHIHIADGKIVADKRLQAPTIVKPNKQPVNQGASKLRINPRLYLQQLCRFAWHNLKRKKSASLLTALGVTIGIAAIMIMMSLGQFAKQQILASYNTLGATTVSFYGWPNWQLQATDKVPVKFQGFSQHDDLDKLLHLFPQITMMTPVLQGMGQASFAGAVTGQQGPLLGVNQYYLPILGLKPILGHNLSEFDVQQASSVCLIGYGLKQRFFNATNPLNKILYFSTNQTMGHCTIIGVLAHRSSPNSFANSDLAIILPTTFYQQIAPWYQQFIMQFLVKLKKVSQIKPVGQAIQAFFNSKYGVSGNFRVDPRTELLSNMRIFLTIFTLLLASISLVSLIVAGIGITNMMLAAIADRLHEIGLYKAIGATDQDMARIALAESILLTSLAGIVGLVIGFISYESVIYLGSLFVSTIPFVWLFSPISMGLAIGSMLVIGLLSGIMPARKAKALDIVSCLNP